MNDLMDREIRRLVDAWVAETEPSPGRLDMQLGELRRRLEGEGRDGFSSPGDRGGGGAGWGKVPWTWGGVLLVGVAAWSLLRGRPEEPAVVEPKGARGQLVARGRSDGGPMPSISEAGGRERDASRDPGPAAGDGGAAGGSGGAGGEGGPEVAQVLPKRRRSPAGRRRSLAKRRTRTDEGVGVDARARPPAHVPAVRKTRRTVDPGMRRGPEPSPDALAAELALLRKARAALRNRRYADALAATSVHAGRFPDGVFTQERLATEVMALCGLGRREEARRRAAAFRRRYPNSKFAAGLLAACSSETNGAGGT